MASASVKPYPVRFSNAGSFHLVLGLPLLLLPSTVISYTAFGILSTSILNKCPSHFSCFISIDWRIFCWTFKCVLMSTFLIFSLLDLPAVLLQ
uniref:Uncharacterized protein n=1 Tax=Panstrongylus lignarius TaxID=156445 RepID=A0A224XRE5_9HEMI